MRDMLPDDPWHRYFVVPDWLQTLIEKGTIGQKTKCGVYQKKGTDIFVFDPVWRTNCHHVSSTEVRETVP